MEDLNEHLKGREPLEDGTKLCGKKGEYIIKKLINCGGNALIYLAGDATNQADELVIKETFPAIMGLVRENKKITSDFEYVKEIFEYAVGRTEKEFELIKELTRKNNRTDYVQDPSDSFKENDTFYLVFNNKNYQPLPKKVDLIKGLETTQRVLEALEDIHKTTLHLDISPGNILQSNAKPDENPLLKIIDFGSAYSLKDIQNEKIELKFTNSGKFTAVELKKSPHNIEREKITAATDIFSVGKLLCYLIDVDVDYKGTIKIERKNACAREIKYAAINTTNKLIMKAIHPNPEKRYASATEMLGYVKDAKEEAYEAYKPPGPDQSPPPIEPKEIRIYTDNEVGWLSIFNRKRRRLPCLQKAYQNISDEALKVILKNYIQQGFEKKYPESDGLENCKTKDLLHIINKQSIVLTGKAGLGKSTALRCLFLHAKGVVSYVRMSDLNGHSRDDIISKFKEILVDKQLVFLDGLDELSVSFNEQRFIYELTDHFVKHNIRFIISMRADHYQGTTSLLKQYFSKSTLNAKHGIAVFDIQDFTEQQFIIAACIVKKLGKVDERFKKNYPQNIPIAKYKKQLHEAFIKQSLFKIPLFSRYAYILVQDMEKSGISLSTANAVEKIIKWEIHDCISLGNSNEYVEVFKFLNDLVKKYLEEVALCVGIGKSATKKEIDNLKITLIQDPLSNFIKEKEKTIHSTLLNACKDSWENISLCLLCVSDDGENVSFQHNIFKEYFLAYPLANTNLFANEKARVAFSHLSKNESFIKEYCNQLVLNGKMEILYDNIESAPIFSGKSKEWYCKEWFPSNLYIMMTSLNGIKIKSGGTLTAVAELIPNVKVDCNSKSSISPFWRELYDLRDENIPITPAMPISNAKELALSFCRNDLQVLDIDIWEAAYKLHKEFFYEGENEDENTEKTNYIALIYARKLRQKYPRDHYGETYDIMNDALADYYGKLECETSRYFCLWFADLLQSRGFHENAMAWAKHGLRSIPNVPLNTDIQRDLYYKILQTAIFKSDWEEFDKYYKLTNEIISSFPWSIQKYEIVSLIKNKKYEDALRLLQDFKEEKLSQSSRFYYLYLLGITKCRWGRPDSISSIFIEMENILDKVTDHWDYIRCSMQLCQIKMKYYNDINDEKALFDIVSANISAYREWKTPYTISGVEYVINKMVVCTMVLKMI